MPSTQAAVSDKVEFSFEQTVPRSLVHKHSLDNVLLTEVRAAEHDRFLCAGRLPTAHWFFNDAGRTPQRDILFYTELGRQASIAISHAFLDVSPDEVFIFEGSYAAVTEGAWKSSPSSTEPVVEVKILETTRRRNNAVNRVVAEHNIRLGDVHVFRGIGAWTVQPAALFQRLRRMSASRSAAPSSAGLDEARLRADRFPGECDNVVISLAEYSDDTDEFVASLIVDDSHPYFFDHPCDHVPGMLLLEACSQLALAAFADTACAAPGTTGICAYDVSFAQFVECGRPTTLRAQVDAVTSQTSERPPKVRISICQGDVVCGTTTMNIAFPVGA
jgi:hypothetical protein